MRLTREQVGIAAAAGAAVLFGLSFPITVFALRSFTPIGTAALSCTIAFVVLLLLAALGVVPRPALTERTRGNVLRLAFVALVGGLSFIACANIAIALSGPTIAGFVSSLYAVLATFFAIPLLAERVRPAVVVALCLSLVGTALLAGFAPLGSSAIGIAFGVIAAVSFGLYLVNARRWGPTRGLTGTIVVLALLFGRGPILLVVELVREPAKLIPANPDPVAVLALAYLVFGPMLIAQIFIVASVARVPARRTSASLLLTPLCAAVGAFVLLGDRLTPPELLGAALLLLGIAGASGALDGVGHRLRSLTLSNAPPYNPDEITRD
ncbi:MAG TPA: DMT family transporter [Candidatus Limnocylindrales bacterium]|nr:DMT family transporter [Candidatus Limnocylindrales bacterium]